MKHVIIILSLVLLTAFTADAQDNRVPSKETTVKSVKPYPNPASSFIIFELQKSYQKGLTISVYSFLGKKMFETQNVNEKTTVSVTDYNRGMYIYYLTDASGKVVDTGKFQVSR